MESCVRRAEAEEVEAAQLGARGQRRRANLRPAQHPPPPLAVDPHSGAARRTDGLAVLRQHLPSRGAPFSRGVTASSASPRLGRPTTQVSGVAPKSNRRTSRGEDSADASSPSAAPPPPAAAPPPPPPLPAPAPPLSNPSRSPHSALTAAAAATAIAAGNSSSRSSGRLAAPGKRRGCGAAKSWSGIWPNSLICSSSTRLRRHAVRMSWARRAHVTRPQLESAPGGRELSGALGCSPMILGDLGCSRVLSGALGCSAPVVGREPLQLDRPLVRARAKDVVRADGGGAALLVPEDEVDPLVQRRRDRLRLEGLCTCRCRVSEVSRTCPSPPLTRGPGGTSRRTRAATRPTAAARRRRPARVAAANEWIDCLRKKSAHLVGQLPPLGQSSWSVG